MSGLAGILAGNIPAGVYHWRTELPAADLQHTTKAAGWSLAHIADVVETKDEVLGAIGVALGFPDYYGRNLDALWDCLRDLAAPTVLLWETWGPAAYADAGFFAKLVALLKERAAEMAEDRPAFVVLLRGEGPLSTGLAELA